MILPSTRATRSFIRFNERKKDLSAGASYQTLVGQPSTVFEGRTRVLPGSAAESVLYTILTTSESADLGTDHQTQFTLSEEQFALIGDWIDDGAKE